MADCERKESATVGEYRATPHNFHHILVDRSRSNAERTGGWLRGGRARDAISNIIERVPESDVLCMCVRISMRWASRGAEHKGSRGGELQSRSLTWGARVMFKRQFWHPADLAPPSSTAVALPPTRADGTTLSGSLCPPRGVASPATDR